MELEAPISSATDVKSAPLRPDVTPAPSLKAHAVVFRGQETLDIEELALIEPGDGDYVVDVYWSGVSTGTERLLWSGDMPSFPGLSYPLVPGYEAVGVIAAAPGNPGRIGESVFVPGGHGFKGAAGVFGASAMRLVVPADRCVHLNKPPTEEAILLALAATAHHAVNAGAPPELIVGHGVLGRLIARITMALGHAVPTVWETNPIRRSSESYAVVSPEVDTRSDYQSACDVSGDVSVLDQIIMRSAKGAEIILAGFYSDRPSFAFPAAFMREISLKIAAEWTTDDLTAVEALRDEGRLSFDDLITHTSTPAQADGAYRTAFGDPACLKMVLDWRDFHDHAH
ncbi:MAG: chlorophyll synthesis pathway protein BchC [Pseudomonadota bacterium]